MLKDGVRLSEKLEDLRDSRMKSHLLVVVWTLRISCHHNHQPSQQECTRVVMVSLADSMEDCTGICTGNDAQLRVRESANDTHHAHSKTTGSRPGTSTDQNFILGVTTQFGQVQ